jgi:hypothetical protein
LVYDTKTTGSQVVGMRFNGIAIPQGATITKAYIQFTVDEATSASCNLTIKGEDSDNAVAFATRSKNVSLRVKTTASVNWQPAAWAAVDIGAARQTPDLKSIIQEIVDRSGWASGNSMAFIVTGTGTGKRTAVAYETNSANAAMLYIEYTFLKAGKIAPTNPDLIRTSNVDDPGNELLFYPIPFTELLNIELQSTVNDKITSVEVFSSTGSLLKYISGSGVKIQIHLAELPSGIYLMKVKSSSKIYMQKIIKN